MNPSRRGALVALLLLTAGPVLAATETPPPPVAATNKPGAPLFDDVVLCRGKEVEVKRSQLDTAFSQFKANAGSRGQAVPEARRAELEAALLDRLVITQLLLSRATPDDKAKGKQRAEKFVADTREQVGSEAAFRRQLASMAFTEAEFQAQILERGICEEVVDRELRPQATVTDDQIRKYYEGNAEKLRRPEMVRASHLLLVTRDPATGDEYSESQKQEKRQQMEKLLQRVRQGEDFAALVREFSEDPGSKDKGGEYVFPRGQMTPEFETAAFSLRTNQVSDIVTTRYGYHIIKLLQRIPAEQIELDKIREELRDRLTRDEVQEKLLPVFLKKIKDEAKLTYLNGAKPPEPAADGSDAKPAAAKPGP